MLLAALEFDPPDMRRWLGGFTWYVHRKNFSKRDMLASTWVIHRPQLGLDSWRIIQLFSTMSEVALELGLVAGLPVRHADVVEHADGAIDGLPEHGEQPSLGRLGEEVVELEHEQGHHHLG